MQLTHLFTATFENGSVIVQDEDDRSMLEPEKRSTFYDVQEKAKDSKLVSFVLSGPSHTYRVDLQDGHFEVNGVPFLMHDSEAKDFRIIFYRTHTHTFSQTIGQLPVEKTHTIAYRIGWQCELTGREHQRILGISG